MSDRIPFSFRAEYRGREAEGGTFTDRSTGEVKSYGPKLKFEYDLADGEPEVIAFRREALDKVADFDVSALKKGDHVLIEGACSLAVYDGSARLRVQPIAVRRAAPVASVKAA